MRKPPRTTPKSIRIPPDIEAELVKESQRTGVPQAGIILAAIKNWLQYDNITYDITIYGNTIATVKVTHGRNQEPESA